MSDNYAARIVRLPEPRTIDNLDNLVAIDLFGYTALTQRDAKAGDLRVMFFAETQLSEEFARKSNLFRKVEFNESDTETGFLEVNRRVKAIRLRGNESNALLMPLESLAFTGVDPATLSEGDSFTEINGAEVCRKYEQPKKPQTQGQARLKHRVNEKNFPQHVDSEHLFRNLGAFRKPTRVVTSQKLHGTSWRGGRVPVEREKKWYERFLNRVGIPTADYRHEVWFGSRRVVKGRSDNNHYYDSDLWSWYGEKVAELIPENVILYGELVGWTPEGAPIQKGFTYNLPKGECELYVYRACSVNSDGLLIDMSWEALKTFCTDRGLKHVPELDVDVLEVLADDDADLIAEYTARWLNRRYHDEGFTNAVPLSDPKSVDEGVCIRVEGAPPRIYKSKASRFLEHESKMADQEVEDIEAVA